MSRKTVVASSASSSATSTPVVTLKALRAAEVRIDRKIHGTEHDKEYTSWMGKMAKKVHDVLKDPTKTLVRTNASNLFSTFSAGLPKDERQYFNCNCCKSFFKNYGNLAILEETGTLKPLFTLTGMNAVPEKYREAMSKVHAFIQSAAVIGPFYPEQLVLGQRKTGKWHHFFFDMPRERLYNGLVRSAFEAERSEDAKNVKYYLDHVNRKALDDAVAILNSDKAFRAEKSLGGAEWLKKLAERLDKAKTSYAKNRLLWHAVLNAPAGFCHPGKNVFNSLVEDLAKGTSYATAAKKFSIKMDPTKYQRPTAAPAAQTVVQAEKIFEKLQAAGSLKRRWARFNEIEKLWNTRPIAKPQPSANGVFSRVQTKEKAQPSTPQILDGGKITWEKFQQKVLPVADQIELLVGVENYCGILTAVDPSSTPILQWDLSEQRNPFSWYVYKPKSSAREWNLTPGWVKVNAITFKPSMWFGMEERMKHHGQGVIFILNGCRDTRAPGLALFPEFLKSELHGIRSVIESFSKTGRPTDAHLGSANGVLMSEGIPWSHKVRVTTQGRVMEYELDRWE